jgi:integrase/recombinase XerD
MTASPRPISPLRQRMLDDMRMRKFSEKTQLDYVRAVRNFTKYLERSPDTASVEDLRNYQLHLVDHGISPASLNAAISGLKFFFNVSLDRPELMAKMQPVHLPRKLPVILSPDEVKRLIAAAGNLKHQTALALAYATGLRVNEVVALKVGDIDSQRMTLRVEQGKGQKDRYAMLSPVLLERLRVWWRVARAQGKMLDGGWLFPGLDPVRHLSARQLNRAIHAAAEEAGIDKRLSMHSLAPCLRHPPAGAEGRHPPDPGIARPQEAGDHGPLRPGRHRHPARGGQPAGASELGVGPPWGGPPWRSRISSAPMGRHGARPRPDT